jgi:bifunctional enzyme CysN/CysC
VCASRSKSQVAVDDYKLSRATGSFIIVDLLHFGTVGAGMVISPNAHGQRASSDVVWQPTRVTAATRANQKSQKARRGVVHRAVGLGQIHHRQCARAGAGPTRPSQLPAGRRQHPPLASTSISISPRAGATRTSAAVGEVSALFVDAGLIVITAFISPFRADRNKIRERIGEAQFVEVYLSTSLEECERRDPKGLYVKARAGEIREFTGIDSPYEPPIAPQITIDTSKQEIAASIDQILRYLENRGFLHQADPGL